MAKDYTLNADPGSVVITGFEAGVALRSPLWGRWLKIAVDHEQTAIVARRQLEARPPAEGLDMTIELEPAMIAISAAAHAIDGFYGDVDEFIEVPEDLRRRWRENRTPRHSQILETLKRGFKLGRLAKGLSKDLEWLFDLRDAALHHGPEFAEPVNHPLGTRASREYVEYAHENAIRAIGVAISLLRTCMDRPNNGLLEKWTTDHRHLVDKHAARRQAR